MSGQESGAATPDAVVAEARAIGWVPEEEFRGDKTRWVDAETFVEKGKTMVPLLRHANKELESKLAKTMNEVTSLRGLVDASQESITALRQFHEEDTQRQIKKAKATLLTEIKQAKTDGNVDLEIQLMEELSDFNNVTKAATTPAAKEEAKKELKVAAKIDPAFQTFMEQNPWFGVDIRKSDRAMGIAQLMRADPANDKLSGTEFFAKVLDELGTIEGGGRQVSKVASSNPSGGGSGSSTGRKGFADLPPDAKSKCLQQAKKLVGPGRAFKDQVSWQNHYVEQYFKGE